MKGISYQKIKIDVGTDYLEKNDKNYPFTSIEQGLIRCLELSKELSKPVKLVLDTTFDDGEYKVQTIATINYNILNSSINGYFNPQLHQAIDF